GRGLASPAARQGPRRRSRPTDSSYAPPDDVPPQSPVGHRRQVDRLAHDLPPRNRRDHQPVRRGWSDSSGFSASSTGLSTGSRTAAEGGGATGASAAPTTNGAGSRTVER